MNISQTENQRSTPYRHRVVIIGAGFGGLHAAKALSRFSKLLEVILIDKENHHVFQPLLYQVATGGLSAANIAAPLRMLLHRKKNVWLRHGKVIDIDLSRHVVHLEDSDVLFDSLVLATGASPGYFGHKEWEAVAPPLKTLHDAHRIRSQVLSAFEKAEWEIDADKRESLLSFVIVGGGPTGVELAGAIAELSRSTAPLEFLNIDTTSARVMLFHGGDRLLPAFAVKSSQKAQRALEALGVEVRLNQHVVDVSPDGVRVNTEEGEVTIPAATTLWAAGTHASSLAKKVAEQAGLEVDRHGCIPVDANLRVAGYPSVYAIGDVAHFELDGQPALPALAPVAIQQGRHVARQVVHQLKNKPLKPFQYRDKGNLATVGHRFAVGNVGEVTFSGVIGWFFWAVVHLYYLIGFENRLLVFIQWAFNYLIQNRDARLIFRSCHETANTDGETTS